MSQFVRRAGKLNRWLLVLLSTVVLLPIFVGTVLGDRFHRFISRFAGNVIGEIQDNLGVVVACSVACVVCVWLFILLQCWAEGRKEIADKPADPGSDQI